MASNEQRIWNYLKSKGLNDFGVAGLMGNLYAESALNPKNLQQTFEKKLGYTDATYTDSVDNGTYTNFVKDSAGYGLAQWTYWSRKENLLNFAQAAGKSIGDLDMQLDFLWKELNDGYRGVLEVLRNATSVLEASNEILFKFERPANQGISVQEKRAGYGQVYYDKYANTEDDDMDAAKFKEMWLEMRKELQDNDAGQWSEAARAWAISNGLINGNGTEIDGEPNYMYADVVTREQLITVLYRFAQMMGKA